MNPTDDWADRRTWSAAPENVSLARAYVATELVSHQLHDLVDDVRMVVSELATNSVLHARTPFTVSLEQRAGVLELTCADDSAQVPRWQQADVVAGGGRGLHMVDHFSSSWGVRPGPAGGKSVWATFATTAAHPVTL